MKRHFYHGQLLPSGAEVTQHEFVVMDDGTAHETVTATHPDGTEDFFSIGTPGVDTEMGRRRQAEADVREGLTVVEAWLEGNESSDLTSTIARMVQAMAKLLVTNDFTA